MKNKPLDVYVLTIAGKEVDPEHREAFRQQLYGEELRLDSAVNAPLKFDESPIINHVGFYLDNEGAVHRIKFEVDLQYLEGRKLRYLVFQQDYVNGPWGFRAVVENDAIATAIDEMTVQVFWDGGQI